MATGYQGSEEKLCKSTSARLRRLPWGNVAFGQLLVDKWARFCKLCKLEGVEAEAKIRRRETPFGNRWLNARGLFTKGISTEDELAVRFVLGVLCSNAWGSQEDIILWTRGADPSLRAGALITVVSMVSAKEKGGTYQCPNCHLHLRPVTGVKHSTITLVFQSSFTALIAPGATSPTTHDPK